MTDALFSIRMTGDAPMQYVHDEAVKMHVQGDWGTQFGMLIEHIADKCGGVTGTAMLEVSELQKLYKESKARFDKDKAFKARAQAAVTRLQSGESEYLEVRPLPPKHGKITPQCCTLLLTAKI